MLTSLFSLFYVTGEFHRFLHRGRAYFHGSLCGIMTFSYSVMFIHSAHVYFQEESLPGVLGLQKTHSEFALIIFYLHLINSGHPDSSMVDKTTVSVSLQDKLVVNEHHVIATKKS